MNKNDDNNSGDSKNPNLDSINRNSLRQEGVITNASKPPTEIESNLKSDIDPLLKPLREVHPSSLQLEKWKTAARAEAAKQKDIQSTEKDLAPISNSKLHNNRWLPMQLAAAVLIGFILGALLFKNANSNSPQMEWAKNLEADATFERVHTNLD